MKGFTKVLALGAVLAATSSFAFADSITGGVAIGGLDSFTSSSITFNSGSLLGATGTLANLIPASGNASRVTINLTDFSFATANGVQLFTATGAGTSSGVQASFTINQLTQDRYDISPTLGVPELNIAGTGTFMETGYTPTSGTFSLSSTDDAMVSFQLNGGPASVTPEPNSLILMGTGLLGAAGLLFMRRRSANGLI